jgi:hypothetical protein
MSLPIPAARWRNLPTSFLMNPEVRHRLLNAIIQGAGRCANAGSRTTCTTPNF